MTIDWIFQPLAALNANAREQGLERQGQLTKPPGSLGLLETMAVLFRPFRNHGCAPVRNAGG